MRTERFAESYWSIYALVCTRYNYFDPVLILRAREVDASGALLLSECSHTEVFHSQGGAKSRDVPDVYLMNVS